MMSRHWRLLGNQILFLWHNGEYCDQYVDMCNRLLSLTRGWIDNLMMKCTTLLAQGDGSR